VTKTAIQKRPPKQFPRKLLFLLAFALVAAGLVASFVYLRYFGTTASGPTITIWIEPGMNLPEIAQLLENDGIVRSKEGFMMAAKALGLSGKLRAGEFALMPGLNPKEVVRLLVFGPVVQHKITIPEGYSARQIENLIINNGIDTKIVVDTLLANVQFIQSLGVPAKSLEGYLFPDTYIYTRGHGAKDLFAMMVQQFFREYDGRMRQRQVESGLSMHTVVTLASIVEKETGNASERSRIASVFFNRLKKRMMLQSDPTVIYGMGDQYKGNLTRQDLLTPTPFNTYTMRGLPPGPIANPGKASLEAVLWPLETNDLYFVSRNNGTHVFNSDYNKHVEAVNQYQKKSAGSDKGG
jgi:UPF0755 protein